MSIYTNSMLRKHATKQLKHLAKCSKFPKNMQKIGPMQAHVKSNIDTPYSPANFHLVNQHHVCH